MEKKYEILEDQSIVVEGAKLYRIRALKDFFIVKAGELGGYIQHEGNLSHEGYAWVYNDAKVFYDAKVLENGRVIGNAVLSKGAKVKGFGCVKDDAVVTHYSIVEDEAVVAGEAIVDESEIKENAKVGGSACVHNHSIVKGYSNVSGNAKINDAVVDGVSVADGNSYVGKGVYLRSVSLINDAKITGSSFLSVVRIGFDVTDSNDIAIYTDPNNAIGKVVVSKTSKQATTWNVNGSINDVIAAQYNDEEKTKMEKLLQAHMDIYNIQ